MQKLKYVDDATFEKNKKFLMRYIFYKRKIDKLENRLLELDQLKSQIQSPVISDMPKGSLDGNMKIDDILFEADETKARINELNMTAFQLREDILRVIDTIDDAEAVEVCECHFIRDMSLPDIGKRMFASVSKVKKLNSYGIKYIKLPVEI